MNKVSKLFLIAAAGLFFVGCYNDYRNPKAAKIYTRADFEKEGLELSLIHISEPTRP